MSDSAARRIIIPDAFFAADGVAETTLTALKEMGPYPAIINAEIDRYPPFLATTEILMESIKAGIGREEAHGAIKKHAVAAARAMREGRPNTFIESIASDQTFKEKGLDRTALERILGERSHFIGNTYSQIDGVVKAARQIVEKYPEQAAYEPRPIL